MNLFTVFFPYLMLIPLLFLLGFLMIVFQLFAGIIRIWIFHNSQNGMMVRDKVFGLRGSQWDIVIFIMFMVILLFALALIFDSTSTRWLKMKPSVNWEQHIQDADVAVAFGFGLVEQEDGTLLPGSANDSLYKWMQSHSQVNYLIAQKGIALAAADNEKIAVVKMHEHDPDVYINTYKAVDSAFVKLDSLDDAENISHQLLVIASDMQMKRVAWLLQKKASGEYNSKNYSFIIPDISGIPFPRNSFHLHTRYGFIYKIIELYYSRPRDYLHYWCQLIF